MAKAKKGVETEPVGIVISSGGSTEVTPRLWAYVWGPAPEIETSGAKEMVAA